MTRFNAQLRSFFGHDDAHSAPEYAVVAGFILLVAISLSSVVKESVLPSVQAVSGVLETSPSAPATSPAAGPVPTSEPSGAPWVATAAVVVASLLAIYGIASILRRKKPRARTEEPLEEREINRFAENRKRIHAVLKKHRAEASNWTARAEHVMDRSFPHVKPTAGKRVVAQGIDESAIGVVIVTSETGGLAGAIDTYQLETATTNSAAKIMREVPISVESSTHLSSVLELMHKHRLTWVPVTSQGNVCGVLSYDDVVATLLCTLQMISEIDQEYRVILNRSLGLPEPI